MANPANNSDLFRVIVWVIVGAIWAFNALINKLKKSADSSDDAPERGRPAQTQNTSTQTAPETQLTDADRRYREVQAEIQRRIARRTQGQTASPEQKPAPAAYVPSPLALPPIGRPIRPAARPQAPAPQARPVAVPAAMPVEIKTPLSMPVAPIQPWGQNLMEDTRANEAKTAMARPSEEESAYAQVVDTRPSPSARLHAALSTPGAARQAFLFREIFDRPLCLRSSPGGLDTLNF